MTDREKLVDLLEKHCAVIGEENCKAANGEKCSPKDCANCLAAHLIAHGVTVKEPQKPLTVEELKEGAVVWLEVFEHPIFYLYIREMHWLYKGVAEFKRFGESLSAFHAICNYGKTWRCWAEKPTEGERQAAEWEK